MKNLLLILLCLLFLSCEPTANGPQNFRNNYTGTWGFSKHSYSSGMNGVYNINYDYIDVITCGEIENELSIPISSPPYQKITWRLVVDENGNLSNLIQNLSNEANLASTETYFIGVDSLYFYYKIYFPDGMNITEIQAKKVL